MIGVMAVHSDGCCGCLWCTRVMVVVLVNDVEVAGGLESNHINQAELTKQLNYEVNPTSKLP